MAKVRSTSISLLLALALGVGITPLSVRACLFSKVGAEQACARSCCPMKGCCAKPAKEKIPLSQPLAPSAGGPELSLDGALFSGLIIYDFHSGNQWPNRATNTPANSRLKRALLCTFLI